MAAESKLDVKPQLEQTVEMSSSWTVYYFDGFSGRAQAAHMLLEAAGAEWKRDNKKACMEESEAVFAMPALRKDATGQILGQSTVMTAWLGNELGYDVDPKLQFVALKIAEDIADVWSEGYGNRQGMMRGTVTKDQCEEWLVHAPDGTRNKGRFARLLSVIEASRNDAAKLVGADSSSWQFVLTKDKPSYVDFLLLNAILTMEFCYGKAAVEQGMNNSKSNGIRAAMAATQALPRVAAYISSSEPVLYDGVSAATGGFSA